MDQATQTMIDNLQKNTGKSLEDWIGIVEKAKSAIQNFPSDFFQFPSYIFNRKSKIINLKYPLSLYS